MMRTGGLKKSEKIFLGEVITTLSSAALVHGCGTGIFSMMLRPFSRKRLVSRKRQLPPMKILTEKIRMTIHAIGLHEIFSGPRSNSNLLKRKGAPKVTQKPMSQYRK